MIGGKKREEINFQKRVGLAKFKVLTVNPNREEFKEILGRELDEESKADQYLGESKEGNTNLRIDVWVEDVKNKNKDKITFFLEDKDKENKDKEDEGFVKKKQYINTLGSCSWADDPNNLPDWFVKREYRVAKVGEEDLYNFLRTWLGKLDFKDPETEVSLNWKDLMKGNIKGIKELIGSEIAVDSFVAMYIVKSVVKESEETKHYQGIYNRGFLPEYTLNFFKTVDYNKEEIQKALKAKKSKELKPHERFVLQITSEFGSKDSFVLSEAKEWKEEDFLVASNSPISQDGADY